MKNLDASIIDLYLGGLTLRQIADQYQTNHHTVKRFLLRNGVAINSYRKRSNVTEESRTRMSVSAIRRGDNRPSPYLPPSSILKMRATKLKTTRDLTIYDDLERFNLLQGYTSKHNILYQATSAEERDAKRFVFIDHFYNDPRLIKIWNLWKMNNRCKWWRPSLDHKIPLSRGGRFDIENLQFLTWFENRAKFNMTDEEWEEFKQHTGTTSILFVR